MKIVMTGGHMSPALSVIENLPQDWEVFFVGRKSSFEGDKSPSLEYQAVKSLNVPFIALPSARLQRKFTIYTIPSLIKVPYVLSRSFRILRKIKPDVVLGFGGYISLPVCIAAYFLNIPVVIHEQTLQAGAANKIIAKWAKMICVSWPSSKDFFPGKNVILTGNPIRKEIIDEFKVESSKSKVPTIYVTGGSTGSHFINSLIENSLEKLLQKYAVVHQTGDSKKYKDFDKLLEIKNKLPKNLAEKYTLAKFTQSDQVMSVLNKSALIVGRAGINTVTELLYLKKPCLLIPLPISGNSEQIENALFIKGLGLAEVLEQNKISIENFISKVNYMMDNIDKYKLSPGNENLIDKKAPEHIISVVEDVAKKK